MAETLRGRLVWQPSGKDKVRRVVFPTKKGLSQPTFFPPDQLAAALREAAEEVEVDLELDAGKPVRIRPVGETWAAPAPTAAAPGQDGGGGRGSRWRGPQRDRGGAGGERRGGDRGHEGGSRRRAEQDRRPERRQDRPPQGQPRPQGEFYNPYNFIPAVPPAADGPLGQHAPCGHDRYREGRWTGRIGIEIVAETPLLIPDAARAEVRLYEGKQHHIFPLRTYRHPSGEERPYLPPTSLKGTLRAAYEAVTNSRLGVFTGHEDPLAYRMNAEEGLAMVPARVVERNGVLALDVFFGAHHPAPAWPQLNQRGNLEPPNGEMYAAWLPRYRPAYRGDRSNWQTQENTDHGTKVVCAVQRMTHYNRSRQGRQFSFEYWEVADWKPFEAGYDALDIHARGQTYDSRNNRGVGSWTVAHSGPNDQKRGWGYLCATNQNIGNKHDERIFFVPEGENPYQATLNADFVDNWRALVKNYQNQHREAIRKRRQNERRPERKEPWVYLGRDPGKTAWSRHVYTNGSEKLQGDVLCYAKSDQHGNIHGLYPVMISRELFPAPPVALHPVTSGLAPATHYEQLSPADRVFGWVSQKGDGAWRGQLRVGPVACETARRDAIEAFGEDGLPLAILSTPKPQQARFYVATDKTGAKQRDGAPKDEVAYADGKGLRGRKAYPHHRHADAVEGYWSREGAEHDAALDIPAGEETDRPDRLDGNGFREYVRRQGYETERDGSPKRNRHGDIERLPSRDDQNRSIKAWVKPATTFSTWIEIVNLGEAELGALLWLLSLNDGDEAAAGPLFHRLGGGKPLGFGSARIAVTKLDLADGEALAEEYRSLTLAFDSTRGRRIAYPPPAADDGDAPEDGDAPALRAALPQEALDAIRAFKAAVVAAYGEGGGTAGLSEEEPAARFKAVRLIAAFLQAARGHADLPVHYPRNGPAPDPAGRNYEWFVKNEQTGRDAPPGNQLSLDELTDPKGLPYWPARNRGDPR